MIGAIKRTDKEIIRKQSLIIINKIKQIKKLTHENAELKKKYVNNITDCEICDTYCNSQLIKAKEIIKEFARLEYADYTNGDYSNELSKVLEQAEQFLKEIE